MDKPEIIAVVWIDGLAGIPMHLTYDTKETAIARAAEMRAHEANGTVHHVRAVSLSATDELTYLD